MLPVEVVPFEYEIQEEFFRSQGATPVLRRNADNEIFVTDNGNYIYDCRFPNGIANPAALDDILHRRAGIVETGLFLGIASVVLIADDDHLDRRERKMAP